MVRRMVTVLLSSSRVHKPCHVPYLSTCSTADVQAEHVMPLIDSCEGTTAAW
jgi:hypothetical protein